MQRFMDIDEPAMRALERHETTAHSLPHRTMRDLSDALLLIDPLDADLFWNRMVSMRWPEDARDFDARLAAGITLFGVMDRRPHLWPSPAHNHPRDLARRLESHGFHDVGGGHLMVLEDPSLAGPIRMGEAGPGVEVQVIHRTPDPGSASVAAAGVLAEAFDAGSARVHDLASGLATAMADARVALVIVWVDGVPASTAKAVTFDGTTYLSSIATLEAFRGRHLAELATRAAVAHGRGTGADTAYLGVFSGNAPAIRLYERLGFASIGEAPDLVLR